MRQWQGQLLVGFRRNLRMVVLNKNSLEKNQFEDVTASPWLQAIVSMLSLG